MSLNARNTDPHTSHDAAVPDGVKRHDLMKVWMLFKRAGRPLADYQLEELLGGAMNGKWRKRRSDLTREGALVAYGETLCPHTGRRQIQWMIAPKEVPND